MRLQPTHFGLPPQQLRSEASQNGLLSRSDVARLVGDRRTATLLNQCRRAVEADTGAGDWDPVVMLAMISARAMQGYPLLDESGQPVLDEYGDPAHAAPDLKLAAWCAARLIGCFHPQVRSIEEPPEADARLSPTEARERVVRLLSDLGVGTDDAA